LRNNTDNKYRVFLIVGSLLFGWMITWEWKYIFDVLGIIMGNTIFWYFIIISIGASFVNFFNSRKDVLIREIVLQIFGLFFLTMITFFFFFDTSNLKDKAIFNSSIKEVFYEEPYTEEYEEEVCSGSGDNRSCHYETRTRRVPSSYYLITNDDDKVFINSKNWLRYINKYHNQYEEKVYRASQTSYSRMLGEGDIWHIVPTQIHPTSVEHKVVNYIKLSTKTLHNKGIESSEKKQAEIQDYPVTFDSNYGKIDFNRIIIGKDVTLPNPGLLNKKLDLLLAKYGKELEVNVIVYLTLNESPSFVKQVERKWITWKKNDVVIFIDTDKKGKYNWVKIEAFTHNSLFKVELRDSIFLTDKWNAYKVFLAIKKQLEIKKTEPNGFARTSMEEYRYLINEVEVSNWWWFIFIILSLSFNVGISYYMKHNQYR
jgi:hypothetical protein